MNKDELAIVLVKHVKWLRDEDGGERADLRDADLRGADLCNANLRDAYLCNANLCGANLCDADLCDADLCDADLYGVNLDGVNLDGVNATHNKYIITACATNYQMAMFINKSKVLVTAGCRKGLSIDEARAHWAPDKIEEWSEKNKEYGERQLAMLEFLAVQAEALGWPVEEVAA